MTEKKKIAIASDHGGLQLKQELIEHLQAAGYSVTNLGTDSAESVDYPDYAHMVANHLAAGESHRAILVCGTGIGMSITANRHSNIRAALCNDVYSAKMSRNHNDANVLVLGGRVVGLGLATEIVDVWLAEDFEGGRHERRLGKMEHGHLSSVVTAAVKKHLEQDKTVDEKTIKRIVAETIKNISNL